jgi:FkbM family methyltransferase
MRATGDKAGRAPSRHAMPQPQSLLHKVLRWPLSLIPADAEVRILRGPLRGKRWIVGAGPHACWAGTYEADRLRAFAAAAVPGSAIYDVGANAGVYSLLASTRAGPSGMVYAFEPQERNLQFLRRHMALNQVQNCVILPSAVCNSEGTRRFSAAPWDLAMGRLFPEGELVVPCTTLDACVYGEKRFRPPNILKIDVEGAELEVLEGASRVLSEFHPMVFLEIHGTELHAQCRAFLKEKGYLLEEGYARMTATWRPAS